MALQKFILKREEDLTAKVGSDTNSWISTTGVLAGGIPGKIYDVAYGPVVHTIQLDADSEIGKLVSGKGVIINAPEYALVGTSEGALVPSLTVRKGAVVECMTAGHIWIKASEFNSIVGTSTGKMYGRKLAGEAIVSTSEKSAATTYAKDTAYDVGAIVSRKDSNETVKYYKTTVAITAAQNTDWGAFLTIAKPDYIGVEDALWIVEVNGIVAD